MKDQKNSFSSFGLFSALKDIGLKDKEALIYLALLKYGENPASTIAKKAGIQRSTGYFCLQELMKKGFARQINKKGVTYFSPVEPHYILERLHEKNWDLENKIQQLQVNLQEFDKLKYPPKNSKVYFFEGKENIENLLDDMLNTKKLIQAYMLFEDQKILQKSFPKYFKKRIQRKIPLKLLCPETGKKFTLELCEIKQIPSNYSFPLNIFIYDNKVSFISLKEELGIYIENEKISATLQNTFDYIWNSL